MANLQVEVVDGKKYVTAVYRGTKYMVYELCGDWFVSTHRLSLCRNAGGGKYYNSLKELAENCKAFGGVENLISAFYGVDVEQVKISNNFQMETYLKTLIEEKGKALDDEIVLDGHIGLTYAMLVDFIVAMPMYHDDIRKTLVMIDFKGGDVFHYLTHLARGMVAALGY